MTGWGMALTGLGLLILLFAEPAGSRSGGFVLLVPGLVLLFLSYSNWQREQRELEAQRRRDEAQRRRDEAKRKAHRRRAVLATCETAVEILESMPAKVKRVERHLDQATANFNEGALSPFWDSIEQAATCLAELDEMIREMEEQSRQYVALRAEYQGEVPAFPLVRESVRTLNLSGPTGRLRELVRKAQRSFEFATIYEQRRTSGILIAGFQSIGSLLEGIGDRVVGSIESLHGTVSGLARSAQSVARSVEEMKSASEGTRREDEAWQNRVLRALEEIEDSTSRS